ncbi:MAG TPA: undecaprenyl-phosphate glucose phosphotransferase [Chloroflexi bacterium]|nr:undecaprenyl-phosphate glucose phosphotransferase [Chloroflexota bacterium]
MSINSDTPPATDEQRGMWGNLKQHASVFFVVTLIASDTVMTGLAFYLAYLMRLQSEYQNISPTFVTYWGMMTIHILSVIVTFFFYRLYHRHRSLSHIDEFYLVFGAASVGAIISIALISLVYKNQLDYPRLMMMYVWILTILLVALGRIIHARIQWALQARGWGEIRLLIIGSGDVARVILQKIRQSPGLGYEVVGFVNNGSDDQIKSLLGLSVLGRTREISKVIEEERIDEVIIGMPEASHQELLAIIANCERERVAIKVFPDVFQIMAAEVSIDDLNGLPLLSVRDVALHGWHLTIKRGMDMIGSAVLLVFASPIMLFVALLIKLDSPGSIFYTQERMGLDGKSFHILKFRSMRIDAENDESPGWTTPDDKRVTRLGAFIRRFSIDETPQFINVLLGDMSLVGPRPERPIYVEQFKQSIPRYMERHREKAGLTGWAQINGLRGDTSIIERTKYDLWYIENWSILLDLKIILRTAMKTFFDKSAY